MGWESETLRFPTNLDHGAIVSRLVKIREAASEKGPPELVSLLEGVEVMPPSRLGITIVNAIALVGERPEYEGLSSRLSMLSLNLKNLK